jgi:hypothetical protein
MYTSTLFFSEFHIIPTWNIHANEHSTPKVPLSGTLKISICGELPAESIFA